MKKALSSLDKKSLLELAKQVQDLQKALGDKGPKNDDELWQLLKDEYGLTMPRNPVCDGHTTPFQLIADLFFNRTGSAFAVANRGGSKTFAIAILHVLNGTYKRNFDSITVGAIMAQSNRAYEHFRNLTIRHQDAVAQSKITATYFKLGGKLEIVPGSISAVNGPHTQLVHVDELELMDPTVFSESRQISVAKTLEDGTVYKSQDVLTSTRKRPGGPVQKTIDKIEEAMANGEEPPYTLYMWCVFDVAKKVDNCQVANPDMDPCDTCDCDKVSSGKWEDGSKRTFDQVCKGKLAKSEGWIPLDSMHNTFRTSNRDIWEAQQECLKPSREGLIFPTFSKETHGIRDFEPDPDNGPIYQGIDFGGTNPFASLWCQVLKTDVVVKSYNNEDIILREGSRVFFDEIYKAELSNTDFAELIVDKEYYWKSKYERWAVQDRFADPAGKAARLELARYKPGIKTHFKATREVDEHIKQWKFLVDNDLFYVDLAACPMVVAEMEVWAWQEKKEGEFNETQKPVKDFDHAVDAGRYVIANIAKIELVNSKKLGLLPESVKWGITGPKRKWQPKASSANTEPWRRKLGGTINDARRF